MKYVNSLLVYKNGNVVGPQIIQHLKALKVDVLPGVLVSSSGGINRYEAIFNQDGYPLKPVATSQDNYWLQATTELQDDRMIIVGSNEINFQCEKHKHVKLCLFENLKNGGFKISTTRGNNVSSITVAAGELGSVIIKIKAPGAKNEDKYTISTNKTRINGEEKPIDACQVMAYLREQYNLSDDSDDCVKILFYPDAYYDDFLFMEMLKDYRLYEGLSAYINGIPDDYNQAYETRKAQVDVEYQSKLEKASRNQEKSIRRLKNELAEAKSNLEAESTFGLVKVKSGANVGKKTRRNNLY